MLSVQIGAVQEFRFSPGALFSFLSDLINCVAIVLTDVLPRALCPYGAWGVQPQLFAAPNRYQWTLLSGLLLWISMHLSRSWGLNIRSFSLSGGKPACTGGGARSRSQTSSPGTAPMKYCSSAAFVTLSILRNILFQSLYDKTPRTEKPVPGSFLREFSTEKHAKHAKLNVEKYIFLCYNIFYIPNSQPVCGG